MKMTKKRGFCSIHTKLIVSSENFYMMKLSKHIQVKGGKLNEGKETDKQHC